MKYEKFNQASMVELEGISQRYTGRKAQEAGVQLNKKRALKCKYFYKNLSVNRSPIDKKEDTKRWHGIKDSCGLCQGDAHRRPHPLFVSVRDLFFCSFQ